MRIIHDKVAGVDVHKKMVVGCIITPERREIRSFSTVTRGLEELKEWLEAYTLGQLWEKNVLGGRPSYE